MNIIFSKYAKQELDDATRYYEIEYHGLGKRFREEVRVEINHIFIIAVAHQHRKPDYWVKISET